jgi:hypothetical protein
MEGRGDPGPEIESFNLSDTDMSVLDERLEMTSISPQLIVCVQNCPTDDICTCYGIGGGCACHVYK